MCTLSNANGRKWRQDIRDVKKDSVVAIQNKDGHLEIFAVKANGDLYQAWQTKPNGGTVWGSTVLGSGFAGPVSAVRNLDGRLEIFAVKANGDLYQAWQTKPNGGTEWKSAIMDTGFSVPSDM